MKLPKIYLNESRNLKNRRPVSKKSRRPIRESANLDLEGYIENLDDYEKMQLWNVYCSEYNNDPDSEIYYNDEDTWNMFYEGKSPYEIIIDARYGEVDFNDEYLTFDGYGHPVTFDRLDDDKSPFYASDIINGCDDLESLFDEAGVDFPGDSDSLEESKKSRRRPVKESKSNKRHALRNKHTRKVTESQYMGDWFGIEGTGFIWNGEWSDPEIQFRGSNINLWDALDYNQAQEGLEDLSTDDIYDWISAHPDETERYLEDLVEDYSKDLPEDY